DQIFIPIYNLAVDTELCSIDPNQFYFERFLDQDRQHHSYARIPFITVAARLMQYITFGDADPNLNADRHLASVTIKPRHVGVTISFD
ncbi:unnamed protein product, partial [Rotaria sp. Silwood1]